GPANDAGRRIVVDRAAKTPVRRRPVLDDRPTIICPRNPLVDFLRIPADIVDEKATSSRLHGEGERVPQAECPDRAIFPSRLVDERIVGGNGAVGIEAEQLPQERVQVLCGLAGGLFADGDVEFSVRAEVKSAALVPGRDAAAQLALIVAFE